VKLIIALALCVFCGGCRQQPSPTVFIDPGLAVLVPADTTLLYGIRMQRIRDTDVSDELQNSPRLKDFKEKIGLVAESDIWECLIASNGADSVALLRGKFTEMGMEPRINKPSATRENYNGVPIVGDENGAVAFLNPTTAIAGPFDTVLQALERRNTNSGVPDTLLSLAKQIPSVNEAWFTSSGPAPGFLPSARIKVGRGGFDPRTGKLDIMVEAESEGAARSIAESVNGHIEGTRVTATGPAPAHIIDWMLGKKSRVPATR
jgi:hypothetical protein